MLKGRSRDPRGIGVTSPPPVHLHATLRPPGTTHAPVRPTTPSMQRAPAMRPEPDYEVVEFPSEQYVNAKLQPPPPPPPRPPTGHPLDVDASCGLCGGGGARVRCAECGRRALCASCDDMYHRHPKRRNHQRQALSQSQLRDERPPLPPKVAPPVPPPRRHKIGGDRMSASPRPSMLDQRRATLNHISPMTVPHIQNTGARLTNHHATTQHMHQQIPLHLQTNTTSTPTPNHLGSMPFLPTNIHHAAGQSPGQTNTLSHMSSGWSRPRGQQGFGLNQNMSVQPEPWDSSENMGPTMPNAQWGRPLRKGASVLELSGGATTTCVGCAHCAPMPWRYGSCASLDHPWAAPNPGWAPVCCTPPHLAHNAHIHQHPHVYPPQTPQPFRRGETRTISRAVSRAGSRAASPAISIRSRTSRRHKHRTPSPPPLPSSDADSESENESDHGPPAKPQENEEDSLGPAPPPPTSTWQCEHCTFVNEPGVRVCIICCRTPTTTAKPIPYEKDVSENIERLKITSKQSLSPARMKDETQDKTNRKTKKERTSTGCGPSPPRENNSKKTLNRLVTPVRESSVNHRYDNSQEKHDIAVGASPPREIPNDIKRQNRQDTGTDTSPSQETNRAVKVSPYKVVPDSMKPEAPNRHSISVGPSPPREISMSQKVNSIPTNTQKKSTGTSPPRDNTVDRLNVVSTSRYNVSNTGTSPPPQSISTQTYEVPSSWERTPSTTRSRPRRRFRDDGRRERSHSRHSLSSDTRESERSVRTAGPEQRWEWRERDSSPGGDWGDGYNRLSRRASHLDLRRTRSTRRSSFYGSEAPSPERQPSNRAISLEALAGAGAKREAERGIELAQLMSEAEKFGFSAAEVQAALAQSPTAPLTWLRERWPSLCAGVRAAATRLQPNASITELEARAALARHKGAMWPAVTECVERHRRQIEITGVGEEGRLRGHVWGSPVGVDDDAAPPRSSSRHSHRMRAEDSSDEFEVPALPKFQEDDWMYLPLNINTADYEKYANRFGDVITETHIKKDKEDVSKNMKIFLQEAGVPSTDETFLLKGLLSRNSVFELDSLGRMKTQPVDFIQYENDFIDAYNALTKLSPIPNINNNINNSKGVKVNKTEKRPHSPNNDKIVSNTKKSVDDGKSQLKKYEKQEKFRSNNQTVKHVQVNSNENMITSLIKDKIDASGNLNNRPVVTVEKLPIDLENNSLLENDALLGTQIQTDEKQNNLSDMVDNTQKLIQQMKEEINSDINSIDGRTDTQSEIEISSEESNDGQESSYSDTEVRTDNLTSDEEEIYSSEVESFEDNGPEKENSSEILSEKKQSTQNRTSSEENENFEEALEHIDNQLEDVRNANIEILDSITRTLQEENTFSVITNSRDSKNMSSPSRKQDLNNNLFVAVNSFDEIYEELNNNSSQTQIEPPLIVKPVIEPGFIELLAKETIIYSSIKTSPVKVFISEIKQPLINANLEIIEDNQHNDAEHHTQSTVYTVSENAVLNESTNALNTKHTISNALLANVENYNNFAQNIVLNLEPHLTQEELNNLRSNDASSEISQYESNKQDPTQNFENQKRDEQYHDLSVQDIVSESPENNEKNHENIVKDTPIIEFGANDKKSETFEKVLTEKSKEDNTIKSNIPNKSSIPKLIKFLPNAKTKIDSHSPKLIVSKVPIRQASIKQYPAPDPPKNHFGNIRSGHVKQLQTRLFNNKCTPSKPIPVPSEPKATTSTLNKKKHAPPPPVKVEKKQSSPPKTPTPSKTPPEKKQYFRETCRTEDEWTDSDSEDSQLQIIKPSEDPQYSPPSPPPPLTLRRVSGQLIDLAKIRLSEGSPERQARMLLAEGAMETWEQAQLAVELVSRGAETPAALLAALECSDLNSALAYIFQDCELCASRLPEHEMVSMLRCTHRCCRECAHHYFTVQITERNIADCVCPYCKLPELETLPEDAWLEYFAHLDILLKTLLEVDVHELFQRKLRDRTLARDPNFRWCMECSSGYFVHPKQKRIRCPECRSVSCATCRKPWTTNHEGLTCEQYTAWLEDNDPERSVNAIQQHLRDNGLECPRCHFKYSLSRGGCMHFTCTQCKYEFCYGCGKPFTMGARCGLSDYCAKLGLHAHHPRNCLFYLRDKEPHELQTLLQMNNVSYETEPAEGSTGRCPIQLQRETPTGLVDGTCGHEAPTNFAGLCKNHYLEYLSRLVRRCNVDPLPILSVDDLETLVRRAALRPPPRPYGSLEGLYKRGLVEIVKEKIPLD